MMEGMVGLIGYIAMISVAAERFTEIIKRLGLVKLVEKFKFDPTVTYQITSAFFGAGICYMNPPTTIPFYINPVIICIVVGLAVSGGSGVWNDSLSILKSIKKPAS